MAADRKIQRTENLNPQQRKQMTLENHTAIEVNKQSIKKNFRVIVGLSTVIVLLLGGVIYLLLNQHDMEECQAKLFTHITGMKAPTKEELYFKKIENPKVYKDLFVSCGYE